MNRKWVAGLLLLNETIGDLGRYWVIAANHL
jgi:hypothetical protein